jgi:hypothetical protein
MKVSAQRGNDNDLNNTINLMAVTETGGTLWRMVSRLAKALA